MVAILASPMFWGLDLFNVVSSTIIQMFTRGLESREFAGRSSFDIKFANSSDTMPA